MLFVVSTACAGCGAGLSTSLLSDPQPLAQPPQLAEPPAWMEKSCPPLPPLPVRPFSQEDVEKMWPKDTKLYEDCRLRHSALRNFYRKRDAALSQGKRR